MTALLLSVAALLASAPAPADAIAPPLDTPLLLVTEETRNDGRQQRKFHVEREMVFAAEPEGWRATVTMRRADATAAPNEQRMFAAANTAMIGLPIVFHLDRRGNVKAIDAFDTVWAAWTAGMRAIARPAGQPGDAAADPFATIPADRRRAVVASLVNRLVATPADRLPGPERAARIGGGAPGASLQGSTQSLTEGSLVHQITRAQGTTVDAGVPATVSILIDRLIDPATGLVQSARQTDTTQTDRAGRLTVIVSNTLTPVR